MIKGNQLNKTYINKSNKDLQVKQSKEMNYGLVQRTLFQRKTSKKGRIIVTLIFQPTINLKRSMTICSNYLRQVLTSKSINFSNLKKRTSELKSKKGKSLKNRINFNSITKSKFIIKLRSRRYWTNLAKQKTFCKLFLFPLRSTDVRPTR